MHRHRALLPRTMAALAAALLLLESFASIATAQSLTDRVTDEAGVLDGGGRSEALNAIEQLESAANIQLWALFVGSTGGEPIDDYTQRLVDDNGLGVNDALFVVAVDDRRYQLWISDSLTDQVTTDEQDAILAERVEPALRDGDWSGSVVAAAEGLADAATTSGGGGGGGGGGGDGGDGGTGGGSDQPAGEPSSGPSFFVVLLAVVLIGVGGWLLWSRLQAGRAREEDDRERERRLRGLSQQANALLIETDELLRHDAQELGFVEAEFGSDAADPFREALAKARAELQAAFRVRQQLDDNQPETPPEREKL
ncbi:MAG TPA: TPM domain-containing protein, partial [Candidatus Limnocylindria bacterium]|nr:TPM domain-containing protein [Candidatus Limnocylindria bacterium]